MGWDLAGPGSHFSAVGPDSSPALHLQAPSLLLGVRGRPPANGYGGTEVLELTAPELPTPPQHGHGLGPHSAGIRVSPGVMCQSTVPRMMYEAAKPSRGDEFMRVEPS